MKGGLLGKMIKRCKTDKDIVHVLAGGKDNWERYG
jgi:hypothetical protein